ncbi:hypothetical protein [Paraliomyxa miuraensis]|uniref:hypothetical protein n=1 Tax=Paraliomyxa miuraensis TaxID=376150 RepID=UPI00225BBD3D|nr:hypothetical protein [Paraliomyxa miuraensis]MCX4245241.1 hypothetical protein [Paraliomyxa miuraensis]
MRALASALSAILGILPATTLASPAGPAPAIPADQQPIVAARQVHLSRIQRTPNDLALRTRSVLTLFSNAEPEPDRLHQWAQQALADPHETLQFHPLPEAAPGLVVLYQPWEDDLMIFDVERQQARPELQHGPAPVVADAGVGEVTAREVMAATLASLVATSVLPNGYDADEAHLGLWREHEGRGPALEAEWIVEYQYTLNRRVAGLQIIDAGVRIGIDRNGTLSSVRLTDVKVQALDQGQMPVTLTQAHDAFIASEQGRFPGASILIEQERVGVLLGPHEATATRPPCLVINYALRFADGPGPAAISRQKVATVSLVSGGYDQVHPVPATGQ